MRVRAAIVGPARGLRGEVVLDVRTDDPDRLAPGSRLRTDSSATPEVTIASARQHNARLLVTFEEASTREEAEALRGAELLVDEVEEADAWYPHQLVGLSAQTPDGDALGTVIGLRNGTAQDLLLVRTPGGTVMVPFVEQLVPEVDVEGGIVVVDAPAGLFNDDDLVAEDEETR